MQTGNNSIGNRAHSPQQFWNQCWDAVARDQGMTQAGKDFQTPAQKWGQP